MDTIVIFVLQLTFVMVIVPIYVLLGFIIYKIYYYENQISNSNEFRDIKKLISVINEGKTNNLGQIATKVAQTAGSRIVNAFFNLPIDSEAYEQTINHMCNELMGVVGDLFATNQN